MERPSDQEVSRMLPKPIYEVLPLLYIGGGIAAVSSIHSVTAIVSGILLASTGVLVLCMRRKNRSSYCKLVKPAQHLAT